MVRVVREICKLIMFTLLWAIPVLAAYWNHNNYFLFLFAVSIIATVGLFSHYEDLSKYENEHYDSDEQNQGQNEQD